MESPANKIYFQGKLLKVNKETLREIIPRIEGMLGLKSEYAEFDIYEMPEEYSKSRGVRAVYIPKDNSFYFLHTEHEGIVFHEAVHYVANKNGLLFGSPPGGTNFYDSLMNETLAELCTGFVSGYKSRKSPEYSHNDFWGAMSIIGAVRVRDGRVYPEGVMDEPLEDGVHTENLMEVKTISTIAPIRHKQRKIEKRFLEEGAYDRFEKDIKEVAGYYPAKEHRFIRGREYRKAIMALAIENSDALNKKEVIPRQFRESIEDGLLGGKSSQNIYFESVVPLL